MAGSQKKEMVAGKEKRLSYETTTSQVLAAHKQIQTENAREMLQLSRV
jgi:hypothetical protein